MNPSGKNEFDVLQSQINPHFLYNTLDIIVWMIENEKTGGRGEGRDGARQILPDQLEPWEEHHSPFGMRSNM